ncbi:SDR family oxidoreductase [Rhodococcus sp. 06-156-3C]|uniref:SDR family NAD(P)-dependent oxidoreductase n=1 Tax=Nocardiaceae TaxID=85025 RepID=UPI0005230603|nr:MULTISPECIES: SDR family NAD(P)-dependent oxidoreductase [Rhodococcus]OZD13132.1 SDR family oxidoreductase [Rhodococcus sp. 06-156-4a]OZD18113.1 SDR family oxidoreductase [Rhodococcus sp. 06-156-3C]OZD20726.1 SDR family oxidoreductase [Rhodococcus sp. 06-156-4C]OZD30607.1 SDR family oxidoreductase [Rhodococcus sp. 06-156-3b]OZD32671.1 SDR family oxidoreductase [Rhodococcus sp. 06-156-3]
MRFDGKTAVVTGAAGGIGFAVAERLATEGAHVVVVDIDEVAGAAAAKSLQDKGLAASFRRVDVSRQAEVEAAVSAVVDERGPIHVLVNNAAVIKPTTLEESDDDAFDAIFSVNVRGMVAFTRFVSRVMIDTNVAGSIVNMSSITAAQGAPNLVLYSASKGAISALTRSVSIALAEYGIRVNAVAPGTIGTETANAIHREQPEVRRQVLARTPLRRVGEPSEVASVVAFLASDDGSYMTGQVIYPDGGRLALSYTVPAH